MNTALTPHCVSILPSCTQAVAAARHATLTGPCAAELGGVATRAWQAAAHPCCWLVSWPVDFFCRRLSRITSSIKQPTANSTLRGGRCVNMAAPMGAPTAYSSTDGGSFKQPPAQSAEWVQLPANTLMCACHLCPTRCAWCPGCCLCSIAEATCRCTTQLCAVR